VDINTQVCDPKGKIERTKGIMTREEDKELPYPMEHFLTYIHVKP